VHGLIDTNVLVYRYDRRFPEKQEAARNLLRAGIAMGTVSLPYQAIVEFVPAVTRALRDGTPPMLDRASALREADELTTQFPVVYPDEEQVRLAVRGVATYQLPWFDALIWAAAEHHGITTILSEDFQDGRIYGRTRVVNPFSKAPC
jgi:predicted nucleic acid-binding protein